MRWMPITPAVKRWRPMDQEFKANLGYMRCCLNFFPRCSYNNRILQFKLLQLGTLKIIVPVD